MGGSNTTLFASSSAQELNDIYVNESSKCNATCNLSFNNNTITIEGSSGNVTIANVCKTSAGCLMTQQINTKLINDIVQKTKQRQFDGGPNSLPALMFGVDLSALTGGGNVTEEVIQSALVSNNITQSLSSSCEGNTNVNVDNNLIVVKDFTGNVNLTNSGTASANCNMTNTASLSVTNSISQAITQTATKIGIFVVIIVAICVIGAVIALVSLAGKHKHNRHQTGQTSSAARLQDDNDAQRNVKTEQPKEDASTSKYSLSSMKNRIMSSSLADKARSAYAELENEL